MKQYFESIPGYAGYYISTMGNVYSIKSDQFLTPRVGKSGYFYVNLYNSYGKKSFKNHRLVAQAFIPNPLNLPQVNHIDGNKLNNRVENLEWTDASGNTKHAWDNGLIKVTELKSLTSVLNGKKRIKKIRVFDVKKNKIHVFPSIQVFVDKYGIPYSTVNAAINRNQILYGRYIVSYVTDTLATTMDG